MENTALLICSGEQPAIGAGNLVKKILSVISFRAACKKLDSTLIPLNMEEFAGIYLLRLPFHVNDLREFGTKRLHIINSAIIKALEQSNIGVCIAPQAINDILKTDRFISNCFDGNRLYSSLLLHILKCIFPNRGIPVKNLDVCIVCDKSTEKLYMVMNQLAPLVKYLTVVCEDREEAESRVAQIYDETGLAIRISCDMTRGTRSANVIINMLTDTNIITGLRPPPGCIVINYSSFDCSMTSGEYTLINSINVAFPAAIEAKIDAGVYDFFTRLQIAEIFLSKKLNILNDILNGTCRLEMQNELGDEFIRNNFKIAGFKGRRNDLKAVDIKLAVNAD